MAKRRSSTIWRKLRGAVNRTFDLFIPLERHDFTLVLWLEPDAYEHIDLDYLNVQIAKTVSMLPGVRFNSQVVTQMYDPKTDCKTAQAKIKE